MEEERDWSWFHTDDGQLIERSWANIEKGLIPWDEVTDDELAKGKLRDGAGGWRHNVNAKIPRKLIPELTRRLKERYDDALREYLRKAQAVYFEVMEDPAASHADRMRASAYVQERLIGKVPDKVEVIAEVKPWEGLIDGILTDVPDGD